MLIIGIAGGTGSGKPPLYEKLSKAYPPDKLPLFHKIPIIGIAVIYP